MNILKNGIGLGISLFIILVIIIYIIRIYTDIADLIGGKILGLFHSKKR